MIQSGYYQRRSEDIFSDSLLLIPLKRGHLECSPSDFGLRIPYKMNLYGRFMFSWLMNVVSKIFGNTAKTNMENKKDEKNVSAENWIGPDGVETGPNVVENWYIAYDGPAPIVEDIYEENYAVDRGNGAIPIDFYINKWGIPDGYGNTDYEKSI